MLFVAVVFALIRFVAYSVLICLFVCFLFLFGFLPVLRFQTLMSVSKVHTTAVLMPFATKPRSRTTVNVNLDILGMGESAKVIVTTRTIKKRESSTEVMAPPNFGLFNSKKKRGNQINSNYFEIKVNSKLQANCSRMTAPLL